jgi:hypothetical protein
MRVWYKKFVRIPINTAGRTFELIAGDLKTQAKASHNKIKRRLKQRQDRAAGDRADRATTELAAAQNPEDSEVVEEAEPRKGLR